MRRGLVVVALGAVLIAAPGVADASIISGSYFGFTTGAGGWATDSDRWRGTSSGHAKICGDVVNSTTQFGNDMDIWRVLALRPDPAITTATLWYHHPYACGGPAATSTNQSYYAGHYRIRETHPHSGYVAADNG